MPGSTKLMPAFKWAGMAAIASHHVRLALFPLPLDADRYVNIGLLRRRMLVVDDVHVIHMRLLDPSLRRILGQARPSP